MIYPQQIVFTWLEYTASGAILLAAARIALGRLRQPADRINLILMTFLAAAVAPLLASLAPVPAWHLGLLSNAQPDHTAQPAPTTGIVRQGAPERPASGEIVTRHAPSGGTQVGSGASAPATAPPMRLDRWWFAAMGLLGFYGLAAVLFLAEWIVGARRLDRMAARARPLGAEDVWKHVSKGRGGRARVLVSSEIATPLAFGCLRPTILIPDAVAAGEPAALRYCLAHEWSHVTNGHLRAWGLIWPCQFLLLFQPLFWTLRRELRVCQDFIADHVAAGAGREAIEYSQLLLAFARLRRERPMAGAISFLNRSSLLSRRIRMLLTPTLALRSRSPRAFCLTAATLSMLSAALVGAVRLGSVEADDAQPPSAAKNQPRPKDQTPAAKAGKPETLRYTGLVLDKQTGKPIAGAAVVVSRQKFTQQDEETIRETRHKTDREGRYSFEIPPEEVAITGLHVWVNAEHDGYVTSGDGDLLSVIRTNEGLGERPPFEKLQLRPAEPIGGTVVAPDGRPLAGVKVRGFSGVDRSNRERGHWAEDTTDGAGRFRLNFVKDGWGTIWILPTQYASTARVVDKQRGDLGRIRLRHGVRVSGRALSAEGRPLPNLAVKIQYLRGGDEPDNGFPSVPAGYFLARSAVTDRDGRFVFDPVSTGNYRVTPVEHRLDPIVDDFTRYEIPGTFLPVSVEIEEGAAAAPLEIQASPHILFHARFVDSQGAPTRELPNDLYFVLSGGLDGQGWHSEGVPNAQGMTTLRVPHGLQNATLQFMTTESGSVRFRRGTGKPLENHVFQAALGTLNDDVDGFEVVYYRAPIVLVNAVDEHGKPVKGFHVTGAYPWGKQVYTVEGDLRSDLGFSRQTDDRYRTREMLPDEDVTFTVTARGYKSASVTVRLGEGETKELALTLHKAAGPK